MNNLEYSVNTLISDLEKTNRNYNVIVSIGRDSQLRDLSYYTNLELNPSLTTVLIIFSEVDDSIPSFHDEFLSMKKSYYRYSKSQRDLQIYLIPYYLPTYENIEGLENLQDLIDYTREPRIRKQINNNSIIFSYNKNSLEINKINNLGRIVKDMFFRYPFMIRITQFCQNNIENNGKIYLLNRYIYNSTLIFRVSNKNFYLSMIDINDYMYRIPYIYFFIYLFKDNDNFKIMIERDTRDMKRELINTINTISIPSLFNETNLADDFLSLPRIYPIEKTKIIKDKKSYDKIKKDIMKDKEAQIQIQDYRGSFNLLLNRNIITYGSQEIQIPYDSLEHARDKEWLDSYNIILGINNLLNKLDTIKNIDRFNKIRVCIPEIQRDILNNNMEITSNITNMLTSDNVELLIIPINTNGIHWTLLMITNFINDNMIKCYHIDSLSNLLYKPKTEFKDKSEFIKGKIEKEEKITFKKMKDINKIKDTDKSNNNFKSNNQVAESICNNLYGISPIKHIELKDQTNDYDCGVFILLHLKIIITGYLSNNEDIIGYLVSKIQGIKIKDEILNIRRDIYSYNQGGKMKKTNRKISKRNIKRQKKQKRNRKTNKKNKRKTIKK